MGYDELLEDAYSKMPEKAGSGERFDIPVLDSFNEGNKTILKNFQAACLKIRRAASEVSKFLSKELATPATVEGDRLVLHRKLKPEAVNKKFEEYVNGHVLCKQCGKPDTHIDSGSGQRAKMLVCEACGARGVVR
ncbi:MAG TPA: translation initiation factor IF-2 subunit beta [Candidatus Bilamarchaeaceae archaeon]|nr:translation initiation factor IF-2 subunit beta [Candidatus Bilamarchaeaceae archaeon]